MIFGLSKYYCKTQYKESRFGFDLTFNEYYCVYGTNNYFYNYHYSISISIFIIPFLFFLKMLLLKKYMEITEINAFLLMFKTYFIEFFVSIIIFLIITNRKLNKDNFPFKLSYSIVYFITSDFQDFLFLFFLQKTSLFYIFILLVFRKLDFHLLAGFNGKANYFLFMLIKN